jgi:hypothetical protein
MDLSFNSATQYTLGSQPVYDVANGLINFGYVGAGANTPSGWTNSSSPSAGVNASNPNAYFKLPDYALPYCPSASYDTSFSYTYRHGNVLTGINAATVVGGGTYGSGKAFSAQIYTNGTNAYLAEWYSLAGTNISPYAANSVFSVTYQASGTTTASAEYLYLTQGSTVNTISTGLVSSIRQQTPNNNAIGYNLAWGNAPLNGQLYNMYYFSSSLFNQDRRLVEATPYQYSAPAAITGLAASSVTATTFALAWNAYSGAASYTIFVNGAQNTTTTSTSLTVTPTGGGPWAVSVYAYNASNVLLASNYVSVSPGTLFDTYYLLFGFTATYGLDNTTNGGAVTKWTDQRMGVTITGSGTYNSNILNGLPMMSSLLLTFPSSFLSTAPFLGNFSMFFVVNIGNVSGGNSDLLRGPSFFITIQSSYLSIGMQNVGYAPQPTATVSNNTNYIFTILSSCAGGSNPMVITYRYNGVDKTPGSNTWAVKPLMQSLALESGQCSIGEFIMYGANLGVSGAQTVEQYLSKKWQIPIGTTPTIAATSPYIN